MTTLATAISAAITKSLLAKLPADAASKFQLSEEEFKAFLQEFLQGQLGKAAKGGRTAGPRGTDGRGRITGYIYYSNENREAVKTENPAMAFKDVGSTLGGMWKALTPDERADWNRRAVEHNEANGLPTPAPKTPAAAKAGKKAAPAAAAAAEPAEAMKIARHQESKTWVIQGTNFVVQSPKNKTVIGKLRGTKVVTLAAADTVKCATNGWSVKAAPVKKPAAAADGSNDDDS